MSEVGRRKGGWDWYGTLTFRDRTEEEAARGWTKVGVYYANRAFHEWLNVVRDQVSLSGFVDGSGESVSAGAGAGVYWFKALEFQRSRGVPHVHCLIGGVGETYARACWEQWFNDEGFARIVRYDETKGARFYLCKYVTKELGEVGFSHNLNKIRQEVLSGYSA